MNVIKKTITIDKEAFDKIEKHIDKYGGNVTGVIRLALQKFFKIKLKKKK